MRRYCTAYCGAYRSPAVDMDAMMAEMQSINQVMGPLMIRIQADLQGYAFAEEMASVRAQVEQIYARMANLMTQLQAGARDYGCHPRASGSPDDGAYARNGSAAAAAGQSSRPISGDDGPSSMQMMQKMQEMLQQMQSQQSSQDACQV